MFRSYIHIAWRNLVKDRMSSVINIGGLAVGMAVAFLIGLWIYDETQFNKNFANYDRIAQVYQRQTVNGETEAFLGQPLPLVKELQTNYRNTFKYVVVSGWKGDNTLAFGDKQLSKTGTFMGEDAPRLLTLSMRRGNWDGLKDPHSILLSASAAKVFFGDADPLGRTIRIGNAMDATVTGVYENMPNNSQFANLDFIGAWPMYAFGADWVKRSETQWDNNSFQILTELADGVGMAAADKAIVDVKRRHESREDQKYNSRLFLLPMKDWHLRSHFEAGVQTGGLIEYVRLFAIVAIFVLFLACINFMNLSTARSEKRAREVGIRKTIGSLKSQLVAQFYLESFWTVLHAGVLAVLLAWLALPWFNGVSDKQLSMPWGSPFFWLIGLGFCTLTGLIAGSYPALYLSSFRPIRVLKGATQAGRAASLPRKVLVVLQFSISLALIIGTVIVYGQIQHTKDRPKGYNAGGVVMVQMKSPDFFSVGYDVMRNAMLRSGAVSEFAESSSPLTETWQASAGFSWPGKPPGLTGDFTTTWVSHDYGKTIGWQIVQGRDFSRGYASDSTSVIINESLARFMGITNPVGTRLTWGSGSDASNYTIVGVVRNLVIDDPYGEIRGGIYFMNYKNFNWMTIKLDPRMGTAAALERVASVFKQYIPSAPFDYKFASSEYAHKFAAEERIGTLSGFFAALAILISCLGLFGLASFVAEQRTKEIGIRKVLGASVFALWRLLSTDFVWLVCIALVIATPLSWLFMRHWLDHYAYRMSIGWWIFAVSGAGVVLLTVATVSFQA
ncbi:MAG TPA: ABC transporter permease, partial [Dinghuibacter sp.]|uniref:ABC transporter permease n=1 Tax=Dinghuibacter sp. TaxID=2024697 RepID=UPI002D182870